MPCLCSSPVIKQQFIPTLGDIRGNQSVKSSLSLTSCNVTESQPSELGSQVPSELSLFSKFDFQGRKDKQFLYLLRTEAELDHL